MARLKKIQGLIERLITDLDESQEIFLEERPTLNNNKNEPLKITVSERKKQNEANIKATSKILDKEIQREIRDNEQGGV